MTVNALAEALSLNILSPGDPDAEIESVYCGDLLSWVMGRADENCAWITIMSNQNVAAVAVLVDMACVILAEGVSPDADLLSRCKTQDICLMASDKSAYELAWQLHELLQL